MLCNYCTVKITEALLFVTQVFPLRWSFFAAFRLFSAKIEYDGAFAAKLGATAEAPFFKRTEKSYAVFRVQLSRGGTYPVAPFVAPKEYKKLV